MEPEDKILSFLAEPDNIEIAVDVARRIDKLHNHFHAEFWPAVSAELTTRLDQSPYKNTWMISEFNRKHRDNWVNIQITYQLPPNITHTPEILTITLEQGKPLDYQLYFGVKWRNHHGRAANLPEFLTLKEFLRENFYKPKDKLWTIISSTGYSARGDKFLIRMAKERENFIREIVDKPWQLFLLTVDHLTTINQTTLSKLQELPSN
ncbi:MAG: hypothetical protein KC421_03705 [Anaerolineales bacterium]|nr:hypothetical protein [Anaerolineales bacterium]